MKRSKRSEWNIKVYKNNMSSDDDGGTTGLLYYINVPPPKSKGKKMRQQQNTNALNSRITQHAWRTLENFDITESNR